LPASIASSSSCRPQAARSIRPCSPLPSSPASPRSTASAAPRRSQRSPTALRSIAAVDKITGPGNAYVAAAKRHVFGTVGIDMIAGPSEVLVIADKDNNPDWIAADLFAQAEHDVSAQSILITDDADLGKAVEAAVERQLKTLNRADTAAASWRDFGAVILVKDVKDAIPLANRIAAEHLEIAVADPDALVDRIRNAGAIFIGAHTPEVIGDYVGGSNHVLPTARSARFSSGLSVLDFVKRTSILRLGPEQLRTLVRRRLRWPCRKGSTPMRGRLPSA
jgi:histidinol dehydrogenase